MSSKPPAGPDLPSVDEFETGVLQGAWEGAKSMASGAADLYKAGERAADVAQRAVTDPRVRQKVWSKIKDTGRDIQQFGEYIAEDPARRIVAAKNGILAAENKAEQWLKQKFQEARSRKEGSNFVGRIVGRVAFEIGSLFVGLGEASEAGKLAEAERGIAKAVEVTECPMLRAEREAKAAYEAEAELEKASAGSKGLRTPGPKLQKALQRDGRLSDQLGEEWLNADGTVRWPDGKQPGTIPDGFAHQPVPQTIEPGAVIDRYGSNSGNFLSPAGTDYSSRALPYDPSKMPYKKYRVKKPLPVQTGEAAPWFGSSGGATQYKTENSVSDLINGGYLEELPQ